MRRWLILLAAALSTTAAAQSTLDAVRAKGFVQCGVSTGIAGFSAPDSKGVWHGIDIDMCRAVAAAVFGDANKVRYTALTTQQRFTALQSGEVDLLARNSTWTISRDTSLGINFVGVNYYDGQGFMVPKKLNVKSAKYRPRNRRAGSATSAPIGAASNPAATMPSGELPPATLPIANAPTPANVNWHSEMWPP